VLAAQTRQRLQGHRVGHLNVGLTDGLRRTGMSGTRPLLAGVNPRATFKALLEARAPLYREVATFEVDTNRRNPNQIARAVLEAMGVVRSDAPPDPADPADRPSGPGPGITLPEPTIGRPGAST
jgi:shikimate kinase